MYHYIFCNEHLMIVISARKKRTSLSCTNNQKINLLGILIIYYFGKRWNKIIKYIDN